MIPDRSSISKAEKLFRRRDELSDGLRRLNYDAKPSAWIQYEFGPAIHDREILRIAIPIDKDGIVRSIQDEIIRVESEIMDLGVQP